MPNSTREPLGHDGAASDADGCPRLVDREPQRPMSARAAQRPMSATDDMAEEIVCRVRRGQLKLDIRSAVSNDQAAVLELIDEAKLWLPSKFTDQWSKDWADQQGRKRSDRVQDSLTQGTTWIVTVTYENQSYAVATVTIEPQGNPLVWDRPGDLDDSAVYLSRLVVARRFAGLKIGTAVLNWACDHARNRHQAKLVRIDVWTRNFVLHKYYRAQGFRWQGYCQDKFYPSRARFQRSANKKIRRAPLLNQPSDLF
jgi:ribosomal protein S18 acetylase RimI-like enzyme